MDGYPTAGDVACGRDALTRQYLPADRTLLLPFPAPGARGLTYGRPAAVFVAYGLGIPLFNNGPALFARLYPFSAFGAGSQFDDLHRCRLMTQCGNVPPPYHHVAISAPYNLNPRLGTGGSNAYDGAQAAMAGGRQNDPPHPLVADRTIKFLIPILGTGGPQPTA